MSDKTKYMERQKWIADRVREWEEQGPPPPPFTPSCWCGETEEVYACSSWHKTEFYCDKHLPEEWW